MDDAAPDFIDPFEGWRIWLYTAGGVLKSPFFDTYWLPNQRLEGACLIDSPFQQYSSVPPHSTPSPFCSCGLYSAATLDQVLRYMHHPSINYRNPYTTTPRKYVVGRVKMWGEIMEGTKGYRSQYAYPSEMYVADREHVEPLEAYGVPVHYIGHVNDTPEQWAARIETHTKEQKLRHGF